MTGARALLVGLSVGALLFVVLALLAAVVPAAGPARMVAGTAVLAGAPVVPEVSAVPLKAREMLALIQKRHGEPPRGYIGGRTFRNRERHLPAGSYREYDVNPKVRGQDRGAERIVIERRSGRAYYTPDHYETFVPMN